MNIGMSKGTAVDLIRAETERAIEKWGLFDNIDEAFSVLYEEFDELWDEVRKNRGRDVDGMVEGIQVGAMALKFVVATSNVPLDHVVATLRDRRVGMIVSSPHHLHGMLRRAMDVLWDAMDGMGSSSTFEAAIAVARLAAVYLMAFFTEDQGLEMLQSRRHRV